MNVVDENCDIFRKSTRDEIIDKTAYRDVDNRWYIYGGDHYWYVCDHGPQNITKLPAYLIISECTDMSNSPQGYHKTFTLTGNGGINMEFKRPESGAIHYTTGGETIIPTT